MAEEYSSLYLAVGKETDSTGDWDLLPAIHSQLEMSGAAGATTITPPGQSSPTLVTSAKRQPPPLTTEPRCLRFAEVDPERKSGKELKILNTGGHRMAWRILSNAPRLYLVNPSKGFVAPKESSRAEVTLIDTAKHAPRHQFVLQMKKAGDEEIDREEIWERKDDRIVHNLRVLTGIEIAGGKLQTSPILVPSPLTPGSGGNSGNSTPRSADSKEGSTTTAMSPADPLAHGEFLEDIRKLEVEVQKALDEKAERTVLLTKTVNEVKQLELELDKETNRLYEVSRRNEMLLAEVEAKKKRKEEAAQQAKAHRPE